MAFLFPDLWKSRAERSGMGGMDPFVPGAIMKNGRLVIHNSMGNFAEAEKDKKQYAPGHAGSLTGVLTKDRNDDIIVDIPLFENRCRRYFRSCTGFKRLTR